MQKTFIKTILIQLCWDAFYSKWDLSQNSNKKPKSFVWVLWKYKTITKLWCNYLFCKLKSLSISIMQKKIMYLFTTYVGMHFTVNKICLQIVTKPNSLVWVLSQKRHKRISKLWNNYWFCRFKCQHKRKTFFHQEEKPYSLFWQRIHKKKYTIVASQLSTTISFLFPLIDGQTQLAC
jgi:hypothetical protein